MKFFTSTSILGFASSIVAAADIASDYWDSYSASDVAPISCASPT